MFLWWPGKNCYSLAGKFWFICCIHETLHLRISIYFGLYKIILMEKISIPWKTVKGIWNSFLLRKMKSFEKTIIQKETCTTMFIAALFTIARAWKQPKCPSTDEWIKKMWHIYTMEYYSAIKRNEIELFVVRWLDLESVIQSEVSQKEKNKYRMLTRIYGI